jgi:hypothetical protein
MAGRIKVFDRGADGLMVELSEAEITRAAGRRRSSVNLVVEVLFSAAEEAEANAREAAAQVPPPEMTSADKLDRLLASQGLTIEELKTLLAT